MASVWRMTPSHEDGGEEQSGRSRLTPEVVRSLQGSYTHRDALGRVETYSNNIPSPYGWYLDPNDARLTRLSRIQDAKSLANNSAWSIQLAASVYNSDGKGELTARPLQYALACLLLPILVRMP